MVKDGKTFINFDLQNYDQKEWVQSLVAGLLDHCLDLRNKLYKEIKEFVQKLKIDGIECFKLNGNTNNFVTMLNKMYH